MLALDRLRGRFSYLAVILDDYRHANEAFFEHDEEQRRLFDDDPRSGGEVTPEQWDSLRKGAAVATVLHLRIETFYLFANITLDVIAKTIETYFPTYFGQARGASLNKHSDLCKNLPKFAADGRTY